MAAVEEAVTQFLHKDAEYRRFVQVGLDAVARGDVRDWEAVEAELRAEFGVLRIRHTSQDPSP